MEAAVAAVHGFEQQPVELADDIGWISLGLSLRLSVQDAPYGLEGYFQS